MKTHKDEWIGVDFDKTLAYYDKFIDPYLLGEPIPRMQKRVKKWIKKGIEVRIFTARVSSTADHGRERDIEKVRKLIEEWCLEHLGKKLQITNIKDHKMYQLWDDRAVRVKSNNGRRIR